MFTSEPSTQRPNRLQVLHRQIERQSSLPFLEGEVTPEDIGTERAFERAHEDEEYVPVILKRTDEAMRHPDDILETAIEEGLRQLRRPIISLALSAIGAGLILSFTAMAVAVVTTMLIGLELTPFQRVATAIVYPLGFVMCLMGGSQLFTEHTATAVYPVLDRRASIVSLLQLWGIVIVSNLFGALLGALLLSSADPVVNASVGYVAIGEHLVSFSPNSLFISAVLAGWLMAQGAWLILSTPPTISQIVCIYLVTFLIGLGGLHHSIAGAVEMFTAYLISEQFTLPEVSSFLGVTLLGNLAGGGLFVALLNYAHIRESRRSESP